MIREITAEEKAFIWAVQQEEGNASGRAPERVPCIRRILHLMAKEQDPGLKQVMDQARRKLAVMEDREYAEYDFRVDDIEISPE